MKKLARLTALLLTGALLLVLAACAAYAGAAGEKADSRCPQRIPYQ